MTAVSYDNVGNVKTRTGTSVHSYAYDRENRLVGVSDGSGEIFNASYDYRTRRMSAFDSGAGKQYVYDSGDCVQERDTSGSLTKQLIRGNGLGGGIGSILYSESTAEEREFFLYNAIGSTVVTANTDASVKSTSLYEAFGKVVASTGASDNNRLFCTKERSASIGLDNFGFRYFDWEIGRFIQRDPAGYPDGLNNYLYCSNNPVNNIDPLGLMSQTQADEKFKKTKEYQDTNKAIQEANESGNSKKVDEEKGNLEKARTNFYSKLGEEGYSIYSDDYSQTIQASTNPKEQKNSAFLVAGHNLREKDYELFERAANRSASFLEANGYDVNVLYAKDSDEFKGKVGDGRPLAQMVKNGFSNIKNLETIQFFSHMGQDINLTNYEELRSGGINEATPVAYRGRRMPVENLKVGNPSKEGVNIDLFGCYGYRTLAQKIADAANARVRAPQEKLGVSFPRGRPVSKTKGSWTSENKWVNYQPGGNEVSSPAEPPR